VFLSRLILNVRSRDVRRDLADIHHLHRTVMSGFESVVADEPRRAHAVLFRLDDDRAGAPLLLVQSRPRPEWAHLPADYLLQHDDNPAVKPFAALAQLQEGQVLRFRLTANPTRKIDTKTLEDGRRRHGRRVELRSESDRRAWLARRAQLAGFELVDPEHTLSISPRARLSGRREATRVTAAAVQYDGLLRVTDRELLLEALVAGIGPGKAYGLGLLSLARP
jgi:CRISPR system Cascade subunit CasE